MLLIHFFIGRNLKLMQASEVENRKTEGEETILSHLDIH